MVHPGRPARQLLTIAAALLALAALTMAAPAAGAAEIDGAVTDIEVIPDNPGIYDTVRTNIEWCVPNGTMAGDTFSVSLPEQLGEFPTGFDLRDPNGALVATASIAGTDPVVATFTMTSFAEEFNGVCGTAFFESTVDDDLAGTEQELVFEVNDGTVIRQPITVRPRSGVGINRGNPRKQGEFTDTSDQCRTDATDCLQWSLESPIGPFTEVTFVDPAPDNASFSCDQITPQAWTVDGQGVRDEWVGLAGAGIGVDVDCTADRLEVTFTNVPADVIVRVVVIASADVANPDGGVIFDNTVTVTTTTPAGSQESKDASSRHISRAVGGNGSGDRIDIEKFDADGNDADAAEDAVELEDGTAMLEFTVTNTGTTELLDVVVNDEVIEGGIVEGLTCDFSAAADGAPTSGTTWAGPFPVGASFPCTAELTGVQPGETHADIAGVTAVGSISQQPVTDADAYHALVPASATTTTTTEATTTTTTTPTPTTTGAVPTSVLGTSTVPPTGEAPSGAAASLAFTGAGALGVATIGVLAFALGLLALRTSRRTNG